MVANIFSSHAGLIPAGLSAELVENLGGGPKRQADPSFLFRWQQQNVGTFSSQDGKRSQNPQTSHIYTSQACKLQKGHELP